MINYNMVDCVNNYLYNILFKETDLNIKLPCFNY